MSTFEKFFDLEKISEAMSVISMEEFITTVAAKGLLKKALPMSVLNIKVGSAAFESQNVGNKVD